jgi:hypothetical protein
MAANQGMTMRLARKNFVSFVNICEWDHSIEFFIVLYFPGNQAL